ncbi:hypothetical protein O6H91_04G119600 [Diphasiastrum complanatum]|uniref:Uncharacterized protein n=1 Tax=Diphasiastrum complanatum TaxID=34168 RepID=A0ACC2E1G6_DIPCM|nr:hypothetical protein O6H91_04G119600 [Diphasiastrum complanatum]
MTDSRSAQELAAWIKQKYGGLDILINEDIEKEISATSSMQSETIRYQEKTKDALEEEKEWMRKVMCNENLYTDLCTTSDCGQMKPSLLSLAATEELALKSYTSLQRRELLQS